MYSFCSKLKVGFFRVEGVKCNQYVTVADLFLLDKVPYQDSVLVSVAGKLDV